VFTPLFGADAPGSSYEEVTPPVFHLTYQNSGAAGKRPNLNPLVHASTGNSYQSTRCFRAL